jgi:hypothetical protein
MNDFYNLHLRPLDLLARFLEYIIILLRGVPAKELRSYPQLPDQGNTCGGRENAEARITPGFLVFSIYRAAM